MKRAGRRLTGRERTSLPRSHGLWNAQRLSVSQMGESLSVRKQSILWLRCVQILIRGKEEHGQCACHSTFGTSKKKPALPRSDGEDTPSAALRSYRVGGARPACDWCRRTTGI
uniref:Uncharacterized protein n=1 Tax=Anguilla anguilla TaxID=7936 RepID=A0A0E9RRA9_ANGAN